MYVKTGLRAMNEPVSIHDFKVQRPFMVNYKRRPTFQVSNHQFAVAPVTFAADRNCETISAQQTQVSNGIPRNRVTRQLSGMINAVRQKRRRIGPSTGDWDLFSPALSIIREHAIELFELRAYSRLRRI